MKYVNKFYKKKYFFCKSFHGFVFVYDTKCNMAKIIVTITVLLLI